MREILFRGKRVDEKGWIYGDYTQYPSIGIREGGAFFDVHPETVGQFTGLLDKNGKMIFESDVLKLNYDGNLFNCEVKYSDGGFLVYENNGFNSGDADMTLIGWLKHDDYRYEVIGNIHDNPNLLK